MHPHRGCNRLRGHADSGDWFAGRPDIYLERVPCGAGVIADGTAVGAYLNFTVNVSASGTYDIKVGSKQIITRGIFQLSVNGTNLLLRRTNTAPMPMARSQVIRSYNATFPTPGNYSFNLPVIGHNSSSSGYTGASTTSS